jgi:hypothetical protein
MRCVIGAVAVCIAGMCHAGQQSQTPNVVCNETGDKVKCDIAIPITLSGDRRACTADPPAVLTHRNTDPAKWVELNWTVGSRYRFDSTQKGVDIADVNSHFEHVGADGGRKYKWKAKNPPGTANMFASYDVHVVYTPGHGQPDVTCTQIDPLIINRD